MENTSEAKDRDPETSSKEDYTSSFLTKEQVLKMQQSDK